MKLMLCGLLSLLAGVIALRGAEAPDAAEGAWREYEQECLDYQRAVTWRSLDGRGQGESPG
jgi:hypothetical protein